VRKIWQDYATSTVEGGPIDCGHYVQEEAPEATLKAFLQFFVGD